jgi:hypothetical protein
MSIKKEEILSKEKLLAEIERLKKKLKQIQVRKNYKCERFLEDI